MHQKMPSFGGFSPRKLLAIALALSFLPSTIAQDQDHITPLTEAGGANCTFKSNPDEFVAREARVRDIVSARTMSFKAGRYAAASTNIDPSSLTPKNFIDDAIFSRMASVGVSAARLTTDEEFLRRIYLDLTGRIPSLDQYKAFMADTSERKRSDLIDSLLYSAEYTAKWTMWWGDLLQNAQTNSYRSQQQGARNNLHSWIGTSVSQNKAIKDIVFEVLTGKGNTEASGDASPTTWENRWRTPGGPIEDTYDTLFARSASAFMGLGHYDCLLCHDGRRHLDSISLWGKQATRLEALQMSAYFSRIRYTDRGGTDPMYPNSTEVGDATAGTYNMITTFGNRPNRVQIGTQRSASPVWRMQTVEPTSGDWRAMFADRLVKDRMFARNFANRFWKELFNMGLVDPVDQLDPARLDPKNPPPSDWALQATHPALLERLADSLIDGNFNMREFMRTIVESNAYQLSSDYGDGWKLEYVPLFARHYPRRLEGEEVHDAMQVATNVLGRYTIGGWADPISWAMQMPEPVEPRSNGTVRDFMGLFLRGNRDNQFRSQDGSILQQLNLMNSSVLTSRAKVAASSVLKAVSTMTSTDAMTEELFIRFLGRHPSDSEKAKSMAFLAKAGAVQTAKNTAVEDMAWVLMNKQEFIFSY